MHSPRRSSLPSPTKDRRWRSEGGSMTMFMAQDERSECGSDVAKDGCMCILVECSNSEVRKLVANILTKESVALAKALDLQLYAGLLVDTFREEDKENLKFEQITVLKSLVSWWPTSRRCMNTCGRRVLSTRQSRIVIGQRVVNDVIEILVMKLRWAADDHVWAEFLEMDMTDSFSGVQYRVLQWIGYFSISDWGSCDTPDPRHIISENYFLISQYFFLKKKHKSEVSWLPQRSMAEKHEKWPVEQQDIHIGYVR